MIPRVNNLLSAVSRLIWDTDLVATRFLLGMAELLWVLLLLWPGDSFVRPTYRVMSEVMPESGWAFVFFLSAVTQITVVLQDDLHSRFARYFSGWNAILWTFVVVSMLLSVTPPPAAIAGEISLAFGALWVWIRPYILVEGYIRARREL